MQTNGYKLRAWRVAILALVLGFVFTSTVSFAGTNSSAPVRVLVIGDSIGEGYGLEPHQAYPALLEKKLKAGGYPNAVVLNRSISGSTSASGLFRLKKALKDQPTHLVLELGGNDGLRAFEPQVLKKNLLNVIRVAQDSRITVLLCGMKMPDNFGKDYRERFMRVYEEAARATGVAFLPFLLEGVGGIARLNQRDGIHPTEEGQKIVAQNVYAALLPLLKKNAVSSAASAVSGKGN